MKISHCIVTLDGKALGLRKVFSHRSAVLSPWENPAVFRDQFAAKRAIKRTKSAAKIVNGSLLEDVPSLEYILKSGRYEIVPVQVV